MAVIILCSFSQCCGLMSGLINPQHCDCDCEEEITVVCLLSNGCYYSVFFLAVHECCGEDLTEDISSSLLSTHSTACCQSYS